VKNIKYKYSSTINIYPIALKALCLIFLLLKTLVQNPFRAYNIFAILFVCSLLQSYRIGNGPVCNPKYPIMSKYLYFMKLILHWIGPEGLNRTFWRMIIFNALVTVKVLGMISNNDIYPSNYFILIMSIIFIMKQTYQLFVVHFSLCMLNKPLWWSSLHWNQC